MTRAARSHFSGLAFLLLLAGTAGIHPAWAGEEPTATPASSASPAADSQATPTTDEPRADVYDEPPIQILEPPDGKWLVDEEGREYYYTKFLKDPRVWYRDGNRIINRALRAEIEKEDEKYYYVRRYRAHPNDDVKGLYSDPQHAIGTAPVEPPPPQLKTPGVEERLVFQPIADGLPRSGQWRNGFALADMNGDGHLDLVHGPPRKGDPRPIIFLGDGAGRWKRWAAAKFPPLPLDYGAVAVADLNRDGHLDLVLGAHYRGLAALVGDGQGKFEPWMEGLELVAGGKGGQMSTFSSRAVATLDWNGDGWPDILALSDGPRFSVSRPEERPEGKVGFGVRVYLNQKNGSWKAVPHSDPGQQPFGDTVAVGDFDRDGRMDFAIGSGLSGFNELLHYGTKAGHWERRPLEGLAEQPNVWALRATDLDQDGKLDLLVGYLALVEGKLHTLLDVFYNAGKRSWRRVNLVSEDSNRAIRGLAVGDFDADRRLDVAALTARGQVWLLFGEAKGGFRFQEFDRLPSEQSGCSGYDLEAADLDKDGRSELVAGFAGERSALLDQTFCPSLGGLLAWRFAPPAVSGAPRSPGP